MKTLSVIRHGHCSVCDTDKTVAIYREDGELTEPVCGACEVEKEVKRWKPRSKMV